VGILCVVASLPPFFTLHAQRSAAGGPLRVASRFQIFPPYFCADRTGSSSVICSQFSLKIFPWPGISLLVCFTGFGPAGFSSPSNWPSEVFFREAFIVGFERCPDLSFSDDFMLFPKRLFLFLCNFGSGDNSNSSGLFFEGSLTCALRKNIPRGRYPSVAFC